MQSTFRTRSRTWRPGSPASRCALSGTDAPSAKVEHPRRPELALLEDANGNRLPLRDRIGVARHDRGVAAADQHGLPPQDPRGILLADVELDQAFEGSLHAEQRVCERRAAVIEPGRSIERLERDAVLLVERTDARAPQRRNVAEATE